MSVAASLAARAVEQPPQLAQRRERQRRTSSIAPRIRNGGGDAKAEQPAVDRGARRRSAPGCRAAGRAAPVSTLPRRLPSSRAAPIAPIRRQRRACRAAGPPAAPRAPPAGRFISSASSGDDDGSGRPVVSQCARHLARDQQLERQPATAPAARASRPRSRPATAGRAPSRTASSASTQMIPAPIARQQVGRGADAEREQRERQDEEAQAQRGLAGRAEGEPQVAAQEGARRAQGPLSRRSRARAGRRTATSPWLATTQMPAACAVGGDRRLEPPAAGPDPARRPARPAARADAAPPAAGPGRRAGAGRRRGSGRRVGQRAQVEAVQRPLDRRRRAQQAALAQVLGHAEQRLHGVGVGDKADVRPVGRQVIRHVRPAPGEPAGCGPQEAGQDAEQARLAAAVRATQEQGVAGLEPEATGP